MKGFVVLIVFVVLLVLHLNVKRIESDVPNFDRIFPISFLNLNVKRIERGAIYTCSTSIPLQNLNVKRIERSFLYLGKIFEKYKIYERQGGVDKVKAVLSKIMGSRGAKNCIHVRELWIFHKTWDPETHKIVSLYMKFMMNIRKINHISVKGVRGWLDDKSLF